MASILGWAGWELGGPPRVMLACEDIAADIAAWAAAEEPANDIRCSCLERPRLCARDTAAPGPRSLGPMPRAPGRPPGIPGIPPGIPGGAPPGNWKTKINENQDINLETRRIIGDKNYTNGLSHHRTCKATAILRPQSSHGSSTRTVLVQSTGEHWFTWKFYCKAGEHLQQSGTTLGHKPHIDDGTLRNATMPHRDLSLKPRSDDSTVAECACPSCLSTTDSHTSAGVFVQCPYSPQTTRETM